MPARASLLPVALVALLLLPSASPLQTPLALPPASPTLGSSDVMSLVLARDTEGLRARFAPPGDTHLASLLAWSWELRGSPVGTPPAMPAARSLSDAVQDAEGALGISVDAAGLAGMRAQEARLDPRLASAAGRLVDALAAHGVAQRAWAQGDVGQASPDLRASALQAAQAVDAVQDALRALDLRSVPAEGGFLFRDPFDLVLIGDAGANLYAGNHAPQEFVDANVNLLTIDLGGDDVYTAAAGGAHPLSPCFRYVYDENLHRFRQGGSLPDPSKPRLGWCGNGLPAAVSIDLAGNDTYAARASLGSDQHQAAQGGAFYGGLGVLVDLQGDDVYDAEAVQQPGVYNAYQAVQGAAGSISYAAFGLLLDEAGNDRYTATQQLSAAQLPPGYFGQQRAQGADDSMLADLGGSDAFTIVQRGAQQSWQTAQGFVGVLLKEGGDDAYTQVQDAGPGSYQLGQGGDGFLIDTAGNDAYLATQRCAEVCNWQDAQGSAEPLGFGGLVDFAGDDSYTARTEGAVAQRVQGAAYGAQCFLVDLAGDDRYEARAAGPLQVAQGAQSMESVELGTAALFDGGGDDAYLVVHDGPGVLYGQGAAQMHVLLGALVDAGGDDTYTAVLPPAGLGIGYVQGASDGAPALLLDAGGHDTYSAAGADGAVWSQGSGVGMDLERS